MACRTHINGFLPARKAVVVEPSPWRRGNMKYDRDMEMVRLYREGRLKVREICEQLHMDRGRLYKVLSRYTSYRRYAFGPKLERRECVHCGDPFWKPAFRPDVYCTKSCAVRDRQRYSSDELLASLERKQEELGRWPTQKEIDADGAMASARTYLNRFGSYGKAKVIILQRRLRCA